MIQRILFIIVVLMHIGLACTPGIDNNSNNKNQINMESQDQKAITDLLSNYERALNATDTEAIVNLYTKDGVFMPSEAPSSIGRDAISKAYNFVFNQIKLNIKFSTDEIVLRKDFAFARTISRGTTNILAAGITIPEENRELFILQKEAGDWKIARYIFNKMQAAK